MCQGYRHYKYSSCLRSLCWKCSVVFETMRTIVLSVFTFSCILLSSKCQAQFRNGYSQWNTRQSDPNPNQGAMPSTQGEMQNPVGQQPVNGVQGSEQMPMNQPFPQNPQFPQNQPIPPTQQTPPNQFSQNQPFLQNQPFPQNQPLPQNQPFPQNQQSLQNPPMAQPFMQPGQSAIPFPTQQSSQWNLTPEGQWARSYIEQQFVNMLQDPTTRNGLIALVNAMRTVLSYPNSVGIIQELTNRWVNAVNQQGIGTNPNVIIQSVQPSSVGDLLKKKAGAVVNLFKDVVDAKAKAVNSIFGDGFLTPFVTAGTNLATGGVQTFQSTMSPFLGSQTPTGTVTTVTTTPTMNTFG